MSILKSEVKIGTANEIGASLEDFLVETRKEVNRHEGAKRALAEAVGKVGALQQTLKLEIDEGKLTLEGITSVDVLEATIRKYIGRAQNILESLTLVEVNSIIAASGMAAAYKKSMDLVQKVRDQEVRVKAALEAAEKMEEDTLVRCARADGTHPGNPLAALRGRDTTVAAEVSAHTPAPEEEVPSATQVKPATMRPSPKGGKRSRVQDS